MTQLPIPGLRLVSEFLNPQDRNGLVAQIDQGQWLTELKRRVQHYGYRYRYASRKVERSPAAPLPGWATEILRAVSNAKLVSQSFDQLIVNEYLPGQGITAHVDDPKSFDNEIVSLSLGSSCVMVFTQHSSGRRFDLLLKPGDLLVMRDEARYAWRHEIPLRRTDRWEGRVITRTRRLSTTFRKLLP